MNFRHPIILGSSSPRRKFLLHEAGYNFSVISPDVDESYPEDFPAEKVPELLSQKKARAIHHSDDSLVITADTIVILKTKF